MVQEGPKLCPTGPKKPGGNGAGKHPLGTAASRVGQDAECPAAQGVLEVNAEGCGQVGAGLQTVPDQNTATTSAAELGGGPTSQANGKTGYGPVDMRVWDGPDYNGLAFTVSIHYLSQRQDIRGNSESIA